MMFEGSAHVAKTEHFQQIESAGGNINAYTSWDSTTYVDTLPSHELELALWLEADRMATLTHALSQESLDNQRDVVKNERRATVENAPYGSAEEHIFALAYPPSHPYHHSYWGSMDDLSAASVDDVRAFFETYYLPNNAVLTIVGDFATDPALELVERHFGPIPGGADPPALSAVEPTALSSSPREEVVEDVPLRRLFVGWLIPPLGTSAYDVADMTADLLVNGRASRFETRLVRELRLAQEVDAWAYPLVNGNALLLVDLTAADDAAPAKLEAALDEELARLAATPPDEAEMARVRLGRATNHATTMQKAEERADRIGMYACLLHEPERYGREHERDLAVSANAVRDLARDTLTAADRVTVWYLPAD